LDKLPVICKLACGRRHDMKGARRQSGCLEEHWGSLAYANIWLSSTPGYQITQIQTWHVRDAWRLS